MKSFATQILALVLVTFAHTAAEAACGTFEVSKGDVQVESAGKKTPVKAGSKICSGDTVIAADQARAKIKMEDGNELNISPNSKIVLENYQFDLASNKKKVLLNVLKGKIRATTREENMYTDKSKDGQANTFQVKTKSAVAGVRGTDFLTSFDPSTNKAEVVTFRGKVEVGLPGPGGTILKGVSVGVGQTTAVTLGSAPAAPKEIPAVELKKIDTESAPEPPKVSAANSTSTQANGDAKKEDSKREPAASGDAKKSATASGGAEPSPAAKTPGSSSMVTDNESTGGVVLQRAPASTAPTTINIPKPPVVVTVPPLPAQVTNVIQKTVLKINVNY